MPESLASLILGLRWGRISWQQEHVTEATHLDGRERRIQEGARARYSPKHMHPGVYFLQPGPTSIFYHLPPNAIILWIHQEINPLVRPEPLESKCFPKSHELDQDPNTWACGRHFVLKPQHCSCSSPQHCSCSSLCQKRISHILLTVYLFSYFGWISISFIKARKITGRNLLIINAYLFILYLLPFHSFIYIIMNKLNTCCVPDIFSALRIHGEETQSLSCGEAQERQTISNKLHR
jgi:hypothetical protein